MKYIFTLGLIVGVLFSTISQTITIIDKGSNEPLYLVTIMSHELNAFTTSNAKGQANISNFEGAEKIEIRLFGYEPEVKTYDELKEAKTVYLIPSSINLDGVVISSTKWNQEKRDVPSKITTISAKEVTLQNPQSAADLLAISGKVFIQKSQQGGGSPMIRGFATNRLLYTIDGVRMNTAIFRGGNIQNVISLDPFTMENSEVLFGPGSVIYGSDAIGGVMSFQTLTPQLALDDTVLVTGKSVLRHSTANNEFTGHFDINVGWKKWAFVTSFSSNSYSDLKMGSKGPDEYLRYSYVQRIDSTDVVVSNLNPKVQKPSGYTQMNIMQKVRFKPNNKWDFQYGFYYSETSDYARYDRHLRTKNGAPRYGEWNYGPQIWMMNNLNITNSSSNKVYDQMTIRMAQQYFKESRISRDFNKLTRETRTEKVNAYSANFDFIKNLSLRNKLFYGAQGIINEVISNGVDENINTGEKVIGAARYPNSDWTSMGIYITDQHRINEKLTAQVGLRYNQNKINANFDTTFYPLPFTTAKVNHDAITGSLGIVYRPTDKWVISSNLATAFRSPNIDDIGKVFDSEPGSVVVPNPNLKPEYAYNADLSIAKIFGKAIKIDVTGFYTQLQNALVRRDYTLNGMDSIMYDGQLSQVQAIQNAAVANVFGVQAGIEIKLPQGFLITFDFNVQIGEEELDDGSISPSRHAAPAFGVTRLSYSYQRVSLQVYTQYSGEKSFAEMPVSEIGKTYMYATDVNGNPYSPGWYTVNFKAMYHFTENFSILAGLENITDQRYRPYSSGIVAPGRNMIIALKAMF